MFQKSYLKLLDLYPLHILGSYFHEFANQFHDEQYQLFSGFIEAAAP